MQILLVAEALRVISDSQNPETLSQLLQIIHTFSNTNKYKHVHQDIVQGWFSFFLKAVIAHIKETCTVFHAFSQSCCLVEPTNRNSVHFIFNLWSSKIRHVFKMRFSWMGPIRILEGPGEARESFNRKHVCWFTNMYLRMKPVPLQFLYGVSNRSARRRCPALQVGFLIGSSSCAQQMLNYSVALMVVSLWLWQANNSVGLSRVEPQRSWWHGWRLFGGCAFKMCPWSSAAEIFGE